MKLIGKAMIEIIQTGLLVVIVVAFLLNSRHLNKILPGIEEVLLRHEEEIKDLQDEKVTLEEVNRYREKDRI